MYALYRMIEAEKREPAGFYDCLPDAVCAMEEELKKEDGVTLLIVKEDMNGDTCVVEE